MIVLRGGSKLIKSTKIRLPRRHPSRDASGEGLSVTELSIPVESDITCPIGGTHTSTFPASKSARVQNLIHDQNPVYIHSIRFNVILPLDSKSEFQRRGGCVELPTDSVTLSQPRRAVIRKNSPGSEFGHYLFLGFRISSLGSLIHGVLVREILDSPKHRLVEGSGLKHASRLLLRFGTGPSSVLIGKNRPRSGSFL